MGVTYIVNAPAVFGLVWRTVRPFIDPVTAAKVTFVTSGADAERDAVSHVGAWELLPSPYGGPNQAVVPVPNIPGEPEVASAPMLVG